MRVLVVADGLEPLLQRTAVGLADRGHSVTVVGLLATDELDPAERFRLGRAVRTYGGEPAGALRRGGRWTRQLARSIVLEPAALQSVAGDLRQALGLGRTFSRRLSACLPLLGRRADVVYFEAANVAADCAPVLAHLGPKLLMCTGSDVRVMPHHKPSLAGALPGVFGRMARIVCRSEELRTCAVGLGAPPWRTSVLYPAVDGRMFAPVARPPRGDGALRLVCVGRQHWVKGYEVAIQAVALSRRDGHDVTLTIVGADKGAGEATRFAVADLGLEDAVTLAGPKPADGVRAALARADAFVLPSVSEGASRAALEAMAMGLPIISTNVGGMPELVTDGREGLLVPARQPAALAEAFGALARDPDRRLSMGRAALSRARDFDAERHLDRIEQTLREAAGH